MKQKDFYEAHSEKLQFFINCGLLIATLGTLIVTSYYSRQNLRLSTDQYKAAINQFNSLRKADSIKELKELEDERLNNQRISRDSVNQIHKDDLMNSRNKTQDLINKKQLEINKQQLLAVQEQAKFTQKQVEQQEKQYKELYFEKRPIFMVSDLKIDTTRKVIPKISFYITNRGERAAHIDSTLLVFDNPKNLCFSKTSNISNMYLPINGAIFTSWVNIYRDCLLSSSTNYYLLIYYKDGNTNQPQTISIYFKFGLDAQHGLFFATVDELEKGEFIKDLKNKRIPLSD